MCPMVAFVLGIAVASCFPSAREAALQGAPWLLLLGGLSAMAPDWVCARFRRRSVAADMYFSPDPRQPDPSAVADALVTAIGTSLYRGRSVRLQLNSVAIAPDVWWTYRIMFNPKAGRLVVTAQNTPRSVEHSVAAPIHEGSRCIVSVEQNQHETVSFTPQNDGTVSVLQDVRPMSRWSHSLAAAGLPCCAAIPIVGPGTAGLMFAAYCAHLLVDQLGHESCRWRGRPVPGLRWLPRPGSGLDACVLLLGTVIALAALFS